MKTKSLVSLLIVCTFFGLTACQSLTHGGKGNRGQAGDVNADGVYTSGAGDVPTFDGDNVAGAPGHDQTYYFKFDDSTVTTKDKQNVLNQARYLVTHPKARVVLEGNTDERGSREYNVALGERRGLSVADILKLNGVAAQQIRIVSYGEEKPARLGHDENSYQYNRRVELIYEVLG
ncbi:MAG: peptidoglycan-associated lipoprotein Pal [Gammaproteobacteria bacterium]